jgi:2,4-dienoyl-CoA reductase-like NADH-dependent reductase (Old Yellow Enzyme family)
MSHLFTPLTIRGVTFRNRIGVSPMCQYSSVDGLPNEWHMVHLGSRAVGGAGLVFTEAAAVTPEGRISPHDLGIWSDRHAEALEPVARFIAAAGAVPAIQLAHAGRKASTARPWEGGGAVDPDAGGWRPIFAPSPLPFREGDPLPTALDRSGIASVIEAFRAAAERSLRQGFRVVEIHAAHGYLLHSFVSPLANRRDDGYGGSFENRIRIVVEVVEAVRGLADDFPLFVRISATDWMEHGWSADDSVALAAVLRDSGADVIDCSSGGISPDAKIPFGAGYQAGFAARIRSEAGIATAAVGLITSPAQAEQTVRSGQADMVLLARQLLREPYWPLRAAQELGAEAPWPPQYLRAK